MIRRHLIFLLCLLCTSVAFALNTDKDQPVFVEADATTLNHKTGINTYRGHVKLTQGTTVITGAVITTYANQHNQIEKAIAIGSKNILASYQTTTDQQKPPFIAVGDTINYYPECARVELVGNARATQGENSFAGPQINYDMKQKIVITPASNKGRTKIIILPSEPLTEKKSNENT